MWWQAILALAGMAALAGVAALSVLPRRSRDRRPARSGRSQASRPDASPGPTHPAQTPASFASVDEVALTEGLIGAYDLAAGSPAIRDYVKQVLRSAGVSQLTAEPGTVFDPARHLAVDTEPAGSGQPGRIARLVRPGWVAAETLLRPAEVIVWTS